MPGFNGSGTYVRYYSWVTDAANGIKIRADRMDTECNGFAQGLSECVTRDGQSPATADLPMGGFKHTGAAEGVARDDYATMAQLQRNTATFGIAAGTANAITASFVPSFTAADLQDGTQLNVRALLANPTATPTFSPDGVTAHPITKLGGVPLSPYDIRGPLHELILRYNLANTRWELINPAGGIRFLAYRGADLANFDGNNTVQTFAYNTTKYNIGGCYDTATFLFTAPVAGILRGSLASRVTDTTGNWNTMKTQLTGSVFGSLFIEPGFNPIATANGVSGRPYCVAVAAGETVKAESRNISAAGTKTSTLLGGIPPGGYWLGEFEPT